MIREARSPFERGVRKYWEMGLIDTEISAAAGKSPRVVRFARCRMGLPPHFPAHPPEKRMALYRAGLNDHEIAGILHLTAPTILSWRKKHGLPANCKKGRRRNEAAG